MHAKKWLNRLQRAWRAEDGPTAVEYAVILALLLLAVMGSVKTLATATGSSFERSSQAISQAISGA